MAKLDLSPIAQEFYRQFLSEANMTTLHPQDAERFYVFVVVCHETDAKTTFEEMEAALVEAGFSESTAGWLSAAYAHGRRALAILPIARLRMVEVEDHLVEAATQPR